MLTGSYKRLPGRANAQETSFKATSQAVGAALRFWRVEIAQQSRREFAHRARLHLTTVRLGIPVKVNIDSGGKPNGIPERS